MASNNFSELLAFLVTKLSDVEPHSRVLSHLTLRSLLNQLSGEHRVHVARDILHSMATTSLESIQELYSEGNNLDVRTDHRAQLTSTNIDFLSCSTTKSFKQPFSNRAARRQLIVSEAVFWLSCQ